MNIKDLNIKLIDLRMYNDHQLSVISEKIGIVDGTLQTDKKSGIIKIWTDVDNRVIVAVMSKEDVGVTNTLTYKGLTILDGIDPLTKREKDSLLVMKPSVFDTKKVKPVINDKLTETKKVVDDKVSVDEFDALVKERELLNSKISKILANMESQLNSCLENEEYEKAAILRDKINKSKDLLK
jgi:hypothetical protein